MGNIKVGEYIRTKQGNLDKVINPDFYIDRYIECERELIFKCDIAKRSKNIIDLIEMEDILEIWFPIKQITRKVFVDEYFKDSLVLDGIVKERIILKTILTKEQYDQKCYRLEE